MRTKICVESDSVVSVLHRYNQNRIEEMAWFGESFANIKGQISSFTKDVLNTDDDETSQGASIQNQTPSEEGFRSLQQQYSNLEQLLQNRNSEVEYYRQQAIELQERYAALDHQNTSTAESYQNVIQVKDQENQILREQLERIDSAFKQLTEKTQHQNSITTESGISLDTSSKHFCDAAVVTEDQSTDDLYIKDLEEQCSSYQNDLFVMCEELMSLQDKTQELKESNLQLTQGIAHILQHDFILDGTSVVPEIKYDVTGQNFKHETELVFNALRQLTQVWKELVEKKLTLERTVTRLSIQGQIDKAKNDSSPFHGDSTEVFERGSSNVASLTTESFFPAKIDTFNLETIMEEESRSEFESLEDESAGAGPGSIHRRKLTPSPGATASICSTNSTQTEQELDEEKELVAPITSKPDEDEKLLWQQKMIEKDNQIQKLEFDLQRLRTHLVDFEEQSTSDSLMYEEREKVLKEQLDQFQRELHRTREDKDRTADVREEVTRLNIDRDMLHAQNCSLEDQIQKLTTQLQNLHFVLEQFQKEKETEIIEIQKRLRLEMNQLIEQNDHLKKEVENEEKLLEKARSGLDAAQQLNAQIEEKTLSISHLKTQVYQKDEELSKLKSQMKSVAENLDGKIDRYLVKNMIVGYFSTPASQRGEVLRVIATVLDFNREDRQKTGLEANSIWPFSRVGSDSTNDKQSLSEAFIRFLETESQPKVELRIPTEEMTRRNSRASTTSTSGPTLSSSSSSESQDQRNSSPSLPGVSEISVSLPVLSQVDRSNSILKDVLNPQP